MLYTTGGEQKLYMIPAGLLLRDRIFFHSRGQELPTVVSE